ncbi:hypothetical protein J4450_08455 [Candidatus Micrarchaeota archaeon]|nr:hypothetical protein [Candidatus Micrarchaeota archaeon]
MDNQYLIVIFLLIIALFAIDKLMNYRGLLFTLGFIMTVALFFWSLAKIYLRPQKNIDNKVEDFETIVNLEGRVKQ